jgi:alanyl-tRNA synthetase
MTARELKEKFIEFFVSKNHIEIPSSRLVPENDPTTLFISAGMQQLIPYFSGTSHPVGKRIVDIQKCVRTGDIEEVGDSFHHTFFEMLGNWSLGDYFKKEMIPWSFEFISKVLKIDPKHLFVTCFSGNKDIPKDDISATLWESLGVSLDHIIFLNDNWWGPAGISGPCGPDSEMFVDTQPQLPEVDFKTGDKQGRYLEIWNDVFLNYNKNKDGVFEKLIQDNVDTGMGVERTTAILNGFGDNYLTSIWQPIIKKIEEISKKLYSDDNNKKPIRIIADHVRSAVFIIADGVEPSNKEAGYVLRRLIRRSIRQGKSLGIESNFISQIAKTVLDNQHNYAGIYPELNENKEKIISVLETEEDKFRKTLDRGLNEINKLINNKHNVSCKEAFTLYESFGFPVELIQEELKKNNLSLDFKGFEQCKLDHVKQSQTLSAGKFKSGLADNSEIITKYHTATHLLHTALRKTLGNHVQQSGSNITAERLRFDFSHNEKLTEDEIKKVVDLVNKQIKDKLTVTKETIPFIEAQKNGAIAFFGNKYPEIVSVYTVGPKENYYSKEVCTGPHVTNTSELGIFEIIKEESAGSGKRRIYAILK